MKKFINDPENLTSELLEGLALANKDIIHLEDGNLVVNNKLKDADRVTIVTLGGTGHEPAISGFVGEGMVDISVAGNVFAAPGPQACIEAIKMADKGHGVLFVVLNHAGDMLTGNLTMKQVKKLGLNVIKVVTQEDIANAPRSNADDRRGLVGCVPLYKIAGAAAAAGKSLEEVAAVAQKFADNMATIAVAAKGATHPATDMVIAQIEDIEKKEIGLVLTKDLSRLGRDYIKTGQYTELFFPSRGVRFIAVGDGYDSAFSSTDLIPFRNVVNEMYARDISRKIRASLQVRMEEGSYIGNFAPYGYRKCGKERHQLTPDPETAPIVLRLFLDASRGVLPSALAAELNNEKIPCPSIYRCLKHPGLNPDRFSRSGQWTANTIIKILHNPVYLGHMVQGKTKKLSFKSSASLTVPEHERIRVPDTHPPIVTEQLFLQCKEQLKSRTCRKQEADGDGHQ